MLRSTPFPRADTAWLANWRWLRAVLGASFAAFYGALLLHPQSHAGAFRLMGLEVPFLRLPEALTSPPGPVAFAAFGFLLAVAFASGFATRVTGLLLLVVHGCLNGGYVSFGWEPLIDPLVIGVVASEWLAGRWSPWILRYARSVAIVALGWIAWSQSHAVPWLDHRMVARYLAHAPIALVWPHPFGLSPLVEILGGFAWLLQLTSPLALWQRGLGRYWASLLLVCHGLLTVFMPLAFWNGAVVAAMLIFVPSECLTLRRSDWTALVPALRLAGRRVAFFVLMAVMLCSIFDRNIAEQFDLFARIGSVRLERTYEIATDPFVKTGNLILFNSIWKMYSPTWRHVVWIEWYVRNADGSMVDWPQENFSPDYRMRRRTWREAIWTDFKKEKVFVGMLSREPERVSYGKYLCHVVEAGTGVRPASVHAEINSFDIRGPDENWSLREQAPERVQKEGEIPCG